MHPHVDVEASVQLRLVVADADAVPLPVSLRYCATDPYAVRAVFSGDGMEVEWVFARDLLRRGLSAPIGDGDVHVWPCLSSDGSAVVIIELCSPDGELLVQAGSRSVTRFVQGMLASVPDGQESTFVDFDDELAQILSA